MDPKALTETLLRVWRIYMTWLVFLLAANLVVLSWGVGLQQRPGTGLLFLCSAWIVIDLLGVIASSWMAIYTRQMGELVDGQARGVLSTGVPVSLLSWFAVFHSLALLVCTLVWALYLMG